MTNSLFNRTLILCVPSVLLPVLKACAARLAFLGTAVAQLQLSFPLPHLGLRLVSTRQHLREASGNPDRASDKHSGPWSCFHGSHISGVLLLLLYFFKGSQRCAGNWHNFIWVYWVYVKWLFWKIKEKIKHTSFFVYLWIQALPFPFLFPWSELQDWLFC